MVSKRRIHYELSFIDEDKAILNLAKDEPKALSSEFFLR